MEKNLEQQQTHRPFFRDTVEIFKRMFSSRCGRVLSIAAEDDYPIWRANLTLVLTAVFAASLLGCLALRTSLMGSLMWALGLTGVFLALSVLMILALRVMLGVIGCSRPFTRVANVVTSVLMVVAVFQLAGGLLGLLWFGFAIICVAVGDLAGVLLLYLGVKKLVGGDREPLWPYLCTLLVTVLCVAAVPALLLLFFGIAIF